MINVINGFLLQKLIIKFFMHLHYEIKLHVFIFSILVLSWTFFFSSLKGLKDFCADWFAILWIFID